MSMPPPPSPPAAGLLLVAAMLLGGCTSLPPGIAPAAAADQRAAAPAALTVERKWLQSWFRDTPVQIDQNGDGGITVDVPREFCFDPGRSRIRPALAAVLDKVAESMRRVKAARMTVLAAPDDASGSTALARQRADQLRQHLVSRGVSAARIDPPSATAGAAVQLRLDGPLP
jgi:outer membrane protein OmpA-like peptidoglycan-associated protein